MCVCVCGEVGEGCCSNRSRFFVLLMKAFHRPPIVREKREKESETDRIRAVCESAWKRREKKTISKLGRCQRSVQKQNRKKNPSVMKKKQKKVRKEKKVRQKVCSIYYDYY